MGHITWCIACRFKYAMPYALCAMLFLFPSVALSDSESDAELQKKQIELIENDLNREKEKLIQFGVKEQDILEQLNQIEQEITEKRKALSLIEESLSVKKDELQEHRERLDALEKSLDSIEELLAKRLAAFYKNAKRGYIKVLLATEDLDLLNHNMKYLREVMDEDRKIMKDLAGKKTDYNKEVSAIEDQVNAVSHLEKSESENLSGLKQSLENEVLLLAKIHKEKGFHEVAVKELQSAADYLKNTISNFENNAEKNSVPLPDDFSKTKGRLPPPLKGRVIKKPKRKIKSSLARLKGIYIGGELGAEVKAVYRGRVEYSGILKGYGQVIVINHGERYFTVSAYLSERKKSEGDMVMPGDVIGYVGEAGLISGPALYFEIRKGEANISPLRWLLINKS